MDERDLRLSLYINNTQVASEVCMLDLSIFHGGLYAQNSALKSSAFLVSLLRYYLLQGKVK